MTAENLYQAIGDVDEQYLKELIDSETDIINAYDLQRSSLRERTIVMDVVKQKKVSLRVLAIAAALLVAAGVAAAVLFGTKKDKKEYKEKKIENYFREDEKYSTAPEIKEVMLSSASDNSIYLSAWAEFDEKDEYFTAVYDSETDSFRNIDISSFQGRVYKMYSGERHLWIALHDDESGSLLVRIDPESLRSDGVLELNGDEYISQISENEDGGCTFDVYTIDSEKLITDWSFCTIDSSMNEKKRVTVNEESFPEDHILTNCVRNTVTGEYYIEFKAPDDKFSICKYSSDGTEIYHRDDVTADMDLYPDAIYLNRSGNPVISACNWQETAAYQFNELDAETGDVYIRYESDEINRSMYLGTSSWNYSADHDLIWTSDGKVYGFDSENETVELVLNIAEYGSEYENVNTVSSGSGPLMICGPASEGSESGYCLIKTDLSGNILSRQFTSDNYDILRFSHSGDNRTYAIIAEHKSEGSMDILTDQWYICEIDSNCSFISKIRLEIDNEKKPVIKSFCIDDNSVSVLIDNFQNPSKGSPVNEILTFDREGHKTGTFSAKDTSIACIFESDDILYALCSSGDKTFIGKSDNDKHKLTEAVKPDFSADMIIDSAEGTGEYDLFLRFEDGVFGYRLSDNSLSEYINWMDSDLQMSQINNFYVIDDNKMGLSYYSDADGNVNLKYDIFSRVDEETLKNIQNRKLINIAFVNGADDVSRRFFMDYNRSSEEYRIHIDDYSKYRDSDNIFGISSHLDSEIVKGNIPDMIIADSRFDWIRYSSKGMFEDIDSLSDCDPEFDRSQYFENILNAYRYDGKQYMLPLRFSIECMKARRSVVGDKNTFTVDELLKLNSSRKLFLYESNIKLLDAFVLSNITEYVDFKASECSFDDPEFIKLLKLIKETGIPDDSDPEFDEWFDLLMSVANDKAVFRLSECSGFENTSVDDQVYIGEDAIYTGIPTLSESKLLVSSLNIAAVSSGSNYKTEAWNIIKKLLNDEKFNSYCLPVNISAFDSLAEQEISNSKAGSYFNYNEKEVRYKKLSKETADNIRKTAESLSESAMFDSGIAKIINDEFLRFTDGYQSAEDTAKNIQNKVSLYLKEIQ